MTMKDIESRTKEQIEQVNRGKTLERWRAEKKQEQEVDVDNESDRNANQLNSKMARCSDDDDDSTDEIIR